MNGGLFGHFQPTRGLHQGDPFSLLLFLLCSEVLSRIILKEEAAGNLSGIKIGRQALVITHLLFPNDLLLLAKATMREAQVLDRCLDKYMMWSRQKINKGKSSIHFIKNFSRSAIVPICDLLQLKKMPTKAKHLGLPLLIPRSKRLALEELKERLFAKLLGWKAKLLSQAGRATLIRSAAASLLAYSMSFFYLPLSWCSDVARAMKN